MNEPLVKLKINGQDVEAPPGMNLIEAAKLICIEIPHFCYHPDLCIAGNCRMCVVEVATLRTGPTGTPVLEWNPKLTIACNTTVSEGMEVLTHTPRVMKARQGVMEFLLINHPLDCPICDQAGECRLQELAVDYGQSASRFVEEKEKKPKRTALGPKITLDDERCILCSRCIRFMRDVAGQDCLGFIQRGSKSVLTCYPGREPSTNYDLNIVDLCPVGALTSTDFRFKQRVWFLKETRSICPHCANGCNIVVSSREDVVYRLTPRDNDGVNRRWMCDEGRLNYKFINDPRRLKAPTIKDRAGLAVERSWPDALKYVSDRFREMGHRVPDSLAIIGSGRATTEELFLVRQLADVLKVSQMDVVPHSGKGDALLLRADRCANIRGARYTGVAAKPEGSLLPAIAQGIRDGRIRALLVIGEDVAAAGIDSELLAKLEFLVAIDMLPGPTTDAAHVVLPGASFAEKKGTFINDDRRIQRINPVVQSPGLARLEWQILNDLLRGVGGAGFSTVDDVFAKMAQTLAPFAGLSLDGIGPAGVELYQEAVLL